MNKIKFSHNWNMKLNNNIFTTIRKSTKEKEEYYDNQIGNEFEVVLVRDINDIRPDRTMGTAILIDVEEVRFSEIPLGLLYLDTGLTGFDDINKEYEVKKLFRKFGIEAMTKVLILTFKRKI